MNGRVLGGLTAIAVTALALVLVMPDDAQAADGDEITVFLNDPVAVIGDIAVGPDGLPVAIVVLPPRVPETTDIGFVFCSDASCRRGKIRPAGTISVENVNVLAANLKVAIGNDGSPIGVVSYPVWEPETEFRVEVIACHDPQCSGSSVRRVFTSMPSGENGYGLGTPGIAVGALGRPIISVGFENYDFDGGHTAELWTIACLDSRCESTKAVHHSELGSQAGRSTGIIVTHDDLPVVAYGTIDPDYSERGSLYLGRCTDVECSSLTSTLVQDASERSSPDAPWPASQAGTDLDLAVDNEGLPVLAYVETFFLSAFDDQNAGWLVRCETMSCSEVTRSRIDDPVGYEIEGRSAVGSLQEVAVTVDAQDQIVVAYHPEVVEEIYGQRQALYLWTCQNQACSSFHRQKIDQGVVTGYDPALTATADRILISMNGFSFVSQQYSVPVVYSCAASPCTGDPVVWDFRDDDAGAGEVPEFVDIDGSVFRADIQWLAGAGITKGCNPPTNDRFCPGEPVTRGQMAAFLVRALGYTDPGPGNLFGDDDVSVFEGDIDRLGTAGVTRGCNPPTNNRFCPNDVVTRGQMAAFLVRALGYPGDGGGNLFVDDDVSVFEGDIDRLGTAGVTRGCNPPTNNRFCPDEPVTRGQMAAFLRRALES